MPRDTELIAGAIRVVRGLRVMLDVDLAALYGVSPKVLNQAVRRNAGRFPADFMFQLTAREAAQVKGLARVADQGRGRYSKYLPLAFTEQGVAMLSGVLRSPRAVRVNVEIMRTFVRLRQLLRSNTDLSRRLDELESKYDGQFAVVFDAIRELMNAPDKP